jgi:hypothetical protein
MAYPFLLSLIIFWCWSIRITAANFFLFLANSLGAVCAGCSLGFLMGSMFDFPAAANMFLSLALQYTYLISGGFSNLNGMIGFNKVLSYASACRYCNEIYFRIFCDAIIDDEALKERYYVSIGYTMGLGPSFACLFGISIIYVLCGLIVVRRKNR